MSNMRLTTLNLDQECLDILGGAKNKSRYARTAIKGYAEARDEADHFEDLSAKWVAAFRHFARAVAEPSFCLATYMDETPLAVTKMCEAGYLQDAIVAAAVRHART